MSNHSPLPNESIASSTAEAERTHEQSSRRIVRSIKAPAQFLSFWAAITLPFIHLPLLAQGLGNPTVTLTFLALLALNVVTLFVGHGYNQ